MTARAVVLCRRDTTNREIRYWARVYGLEVVYTVFTDTESSKLAAMIALQHLIERSAEIVMISYLPGARIADDRHWQVVLAVADAIASDGPVGR